MIPGGAHAEDVPVERAVRGETQVGHQVDLVVGEAVEASRDDQLELRAGVGTEHTREREQLGTVREAGRDGIAVAVVVGRGLRARESHRTGVERTREQPRHRIDVVVGRGHAGGGLAHDRPAQRAVPDEEAGVHGEAAGGEGVEIAAEVVPAPRHAGLERRERDALDARHEAREVVGVPGGGGCEPEAAVPAHHRGDPVARRRARGGVPQQLRVVVRVQVDEAGGDHAAGHVARRGGTGLGRLRTDRDDPAVGDGDVGDLGRRPGAVDDGATDEEQVRAHRPSAPGSCRSGGTSSRNRPAALAQVTMRISSSGTPARSRRARAWVSGHVESAWG